MTRAISPGKVIVSRLDTPHPLLATQGQRVVG
jgi:hypothetical protein